MTGKIKAAVNQKPLTKKQRKELETTFLNLAQRLGFQKCSITCGELHIDLTVNKNK